MPPLRPATAPQAVAPRCDALDWSPQPETTSADQSQGPATSLTPAAAHCEAVRTAEIVEPASIPTTAQPPGPAAVDARDPDAKPVPPASPTPTVQLHQPAAVASRNSDAEPVQPASAPITAQPPGPATVVASELPHVASNTSAVTTSLEQNNKVRQNHLLYTCLVCTLLQQSCQAYPHPLTTFASLALKDCHLQSLWFSCCMHCVLCVTAVICILAS